MKNWMQQSKLTWGFDECSYHKWKIEENNEKTTKLGKNSQMSMKFS